MPGVPSGRGCTECRRVKKKCDQQKPSCSRCRRLNVECVGGGQRRFKFVEASTLQRAGSCPPSESSETSRSATPSNDLVGKSSRGSRISLSPSNSLTQLVSAFTVTLSRNKDERFSLVGAFGQFLHYIPPRLGTNAALDASVEALIVAHANVCNRGGDSINVLSKYTDAINKLRTSLDDPVVASSTETLCATMLLSMTQTFAGNYQVCNLGHIGGMAKIMKYRGNLRRDEKDDFERELLATLRGPVIFEAFWNEKIDFTDEEWHNLAANYQKPNAGPEQTVMLCASRLPLFQRRGRRMLRHGSRDDTLVPDVMACYEVLQLSRGTFEKLLEKVQSRFTDGEIDYATFFKYHFALIRLHALNSSVMTLYGCLISAIHPAYLSLEQDMYDCGTEILSVAEKLQPYRPLGASIIPICLCTGWIATTDSGLRNRLEAAMTDFISDYPNVHDVKAWLGGSTGFDLMESRVKLRL